MYSNNDLASDLEETLADGFDVIKISKVAFRIYQEHGLEIDASIDNVLLMLVAMQEGKPFELTEGEFMSIIVELKGN